MVEDANIDVVDRADEADVASVGRGSARDGEEVSVVAAQPHRGLTVAAQAQHDLFVDLADQDHLCNLNCGFVTDAKAAAKLDRESETLHVVSDLRTAAVDDYRVQPDILQ